MTMTISVGHATLAASALGADDEREMVWLAISCRIAVNLLHPRGEHIGGVVGWLSCGLALG
jgi:hypothetical protein